MLKRIIELAILGAVFVAGPTIAADWTYEGMITACDPTLCPLVPIAVGDPVVGTISIDVGANDSFTVDTDPTGLGPLLDLSSFNFLVAGLIPLEPVAAIDGSPAPCSDPALLLPNACEGVVLDGSGTTDAAGDFASGSFTASFVGGTLGPLGGTAIIDPIAGTIEVTVFGGTTFVASVEGSFTKVPEWTYDGDITACDPTLCPLVPIGVGDPVEGSISIDVGANASFTVDTDPTGLGPLLDLSSFSFLVAGAIPLEPVAAADGSPAPCSDPTLLLPNACEGVVLTGSGTTNAAGDFASGSFTATFVGGTLGPLGGTAIIDPVAGTIEVSVFGGTTFVASVAGSFTKVAAVGGAIESLYGFLGQCTNETTGQVVQINLNGSSSWDCEAAGLTVSPGDTILQFGAGPVDSGGNLTGAITGLDGIFGACRNLGTGQITAIPLSGGTSWDCTSAGFVAAPGEIVIQISRGTVPFTTFYVDDVQPIFGAKCSGCHTGAGFGGHNIGNTYGDAFLPANSPDCAGLNVGQCTIVRIQSGEMPQGAGCTGDPVADAGNPSCLTQAEQDTVQTWIDEGLPAQ